MSLPSKIFFKPKPAQLLMLGMAIAAWIFGTNYVLDLQNTFRETTRLIELQTGYKLSIISKLCLDCPRPVLVYGSYLVVLLLIIKEFRNFPTQKTFLLNAIAIGVAVIGALIADYAIRLPLNAVMQQFSK